MKRSILFLAVAALASPLVASAADGLSYSYLEGGYYRTDYDGIDDSQDGFGIRGSGAITDNWHFFAGWDNVSVDDFDVDQQRVGVGYNVPISSKVDFVGRLSYERLDADVLSAVNGFGIEAGVRASFTPHFEGGAAVRYVNYDVDDDGDFIDDGDFDTEGQTSLVLNAQYKFNDNWGITGEALVNSDYNAFFIGPRFSF